MWEKSKKMLAVLLCGAMLAGLAVPSALAEDAATEIAQARGLEIGAPVVIEGVATTCSAAADPELAFKEGFYVQDETGGILVTGAPEDCAVLSGQTVRVSGVVAAAVAPDVALDVADGAVSVVEENRVDVWELAKWLSFNDFSSATSLGWYAGIGGLVTQVIKDDYGTILEYTIKDYHNDSGKEIRVTVDDYIGYSFPYHWNIETFVNVGNLVLTCGIVSFDAEGYTLRVEDRVNVSPFRAVTSFTVSPDEIPEGLEAELTVTISGYNIEYDIFTLSLESYYDGNSIPLHGEFTEGENTVTIPALKPGEYHLTCGYSSGGWVTGTTLTVTSTLPTTPIAEARGLEEGARVTIRGCATTNSTAARPEAAFEDCIYIQDQSAGIRVVGLPDNLRVTFGRDVRLTGTIRKYFDNDVELVLDGTPDDVAVIGEYNSPHMLRMDFLPSEVAAPENNGLYVGCEGLVVDVIRDDTGKIREFSLRDRYGDSEVCARVVIDENIDCRSDPWRDRIALDKFIFEGNYIWLTGIVAPGEGGQRVRVFDLWSFVRITEFQTMTVSPSAVPENTATTVRIDVTGYNMDRDDLWFTMIIRLVDKYGETVAQKPFDGQPVQSFDLPGNLEAGVYTLSVSGVYSSGVFDWVACELYVVGEALEVASIAQAQSLPIGTYVSVAGTAMTNTYAVNPYTAFEDGTYIQDETRGMWVLGIPADALIKAGQKVSLEGFVCGGGMQFWLQVVDGGAWKIVDETATDVPVAKDIEIKDIGDTEKNSWFVRFMGFVERIFRSGSEEITGCYVRSASDSDSTAEIWIDGNIGYPGGEELPEGVPPLDYVLREGNCISASGFVWYGSLRISNLEHIVDLDFPVIDKLEASPASFTEGSRMKTTLTVEGTVSEDFPLFSRLEGGTSPGENMEVSLDANELNLGAAPSAGQYRLVLYTQPEDYGSPIRLKSIPIMITEKPYVPNPGSGSTTPVVVIEEPEIPLETPDFFDDDNGHWGEDYINRMAALGFVRGVGDRLFAPERAISRAEYVQMVYNIYAEESDALAQAPFSDVAEDAWYAKAVRWAAEKGLVAGYTDGTFRPGETILREDIAVITAKLCELYNIALPQKTEGAPFADNDLIAEYASDRVKTLRAGGILSGLPGNLFDPKGKTTRVESAVILYKIYELSLPPEDEA